MRNRIKLLLLAVVACCASYAQQARISVQQVFDKDTTLYLFNTRSQISQLSVNLSIIKQSPKFFARVILEDQNHRNYLVGETYKEIADEDASSLFDCAEETDLLNGIVPYRLKIYVEDASVELNTIDITDGMPERGNSEENVKVQKIQSKVDKINAYNNAHQKIWFAGVTELSKMPFEDRMRVLGFDESYNTGGFEYYTGGIFEIGEREDYTPNRSGNDTFVDEFDWTNRHGKNWITSIKGQGHSAYCTSFASIACVEALANLYYNNLINLDLSEQEAIICSKSPNLRYSPYEVGATYTQILEYVREYGVCEETAYPFSDNPQDTNCLSNSITPNINVKIQGYNTFNNHSMDSIKKYLITYGPLVSGFGVHHDLNNPGHGRGHAMALVGYGKIHLGDYIREIYGTQFNGTLTGFYQITEGSPYIDRTYYKFKNSNNIRPNDDIEGYMYLLVNNDTLLDCPVVAYSPITITNCQTNQPMYTDNDIVIEDADGDGYYFWGLGNRPSTCPSYVPTEPDGDDSDPNYGAMDDHGNMTALTSDLYLYDNIVYDRDLEMHRNIRILSGSVLRIKGNLTLCDNKQIYISGGGTLIVDGGTINNAKFNLDIDSSLNILNDGVINMRQNEDFSVPVGALLNISEGQVNNY